MIIDDQSFDVIIIGSGAGGGTLAGALAGKGHRVLLLERGRQMPLIDQNVADVDLFRKDRYHPPERWFGPDGDPFAPQTIYALGGNTKIWGGVLERMRVKDFAELPLQEGVSSAWELSYNDISPYYDQAEQLFHVHGVAGVDPTEPPRQKPFVAPPRPLEAFFEPLRQGLQRHECKPYDLPISWSNNAEDPSGDAELFGVAPAIRDSGVQLRCDAVVTRLHVNPSGTEVRGVEATIKGQAWLFQAQVVVLAAGAINTAAILLRSSNDNHPRGLSNGSDQLGRNLMKPQLTSILQLAAVPNSGRYQRSFGINDYYWGDKNVSFPLGHIQSCGGVLQDALFAESPPVLSLVSKLMPNFGLEELAARSIAWWAMTEVLPDPHNKVTVQKDQIRINYIANNREAHDRLVYRWIDTLKAFEADPLTQVVRKAPTHPRGEAPISVMGYACGTCRMGSNPATSVVDLNCRSHEIHNLYIADASVFPSCPSIGLGLTIIANSLRLAQHLEQEI
jgi:choline dehydrogenase-like flavoprotein